MIVSLDQPNTVRLWFTMVDGGIGLEGRLLVGFGCEISPANRPTGKDSWTTKTLRDERVPEDKRNRRIVKKSLLQKKEQHPYIVMRILFYYRIFIHYRPQPERDSQNKNGSGRKNILPEPLHSVGFMLQVGT